MIGLMTRPTAANTGVYALAALAVGPSTVTVDHVGDASNHEAGFPTVWSSGAPDVRSTVTFIRRRYDGLFKKLAD